MTIQISRADITGDALHNLQSETRFLKLPVDPYLDLLGVTPLASQVAIINAINNPKYRFVCAAVSRRQGKTYIANIIGQLVSLVPNSNILIMSPNYALSQISFDLQRNLIKHFDLEVSKDNWPGNWDDQKIKPIHWLIDYVRVYDYQPVSQENVSLALEINKIKDPINKAKEILDKFGLGKRLNNLPSQLSGGEQQRVAIARSIVMKPELILADEPTGNLDSENSELISNILFDYVKEENASLIMVTHDNKLANFSKRIIKIKDGKIE